MSAYEETNVRLPPCAFDALAVVVARRETSRDETVRQLLSAEESAARHHLLLVAEALEEDVSWHSPARFQVAANIARDTLGDANSRSNEQMLYEQGNEWGALRQDLLDGGTARDKYLKDIAIFGWIDWIGRFGSAVWRAERRVSVQDFEDWLIKRTEADPVEGVVSPPGWLVRVPSTWRAHAPKGNTGMPEPYATWVAEGLALVYPYKNRQAVWPLVPRRDQRGWQPVPGVEPVISAAQGLRPDRVVGFIEAVLLDWSGEEFPGGLSLPADKACDFGFITVEEQRQARAEARVQTLQAMDEIIDGLSEDHCHLRPVLEQAKGNTHQFGRIAKRLGIKFTVTRASWPWPGRSVVDEVIAGTRPDLVEWLVIWAYRTRTVRLEQSMEEAWHDAFDPHRGRRSRRM